MPEQLTHGHRPMSGRDPRETHRSATPLELLFDLAFVVAFGTAANELAHALAQDHVEVGVVGFCFATFAISWAWINFSWFASAYDTDDWIYRLTTMLQMLGVLVLALGLPAMFASLEEGEHVDNAVMVAGYVVMRVAMVFQWLRAARQDPARRSASLTFVTTILLAQVGWVVLLFAHASILVTFLFVVGLVAVEMIGPYVAETRRTGTPWHPHHIAERYGLLVIIALGEGMIGTMASMSAIVGPDGAGWSAEFVLVGLAGVAITFGMWWGYFVIPHGTVLEHRRERSFSWGYGHIPLFGATVAVGAGLHVAAYHLEHHSALHELGTVVSVAVPLGAYLLMVFVLYAVLTRTFDPFHVILAGLTAALVVGAVLLAAAGASLALSLAVLALAPWVTVVGYELVGHRHNEDVVAAL